MILLFSSEGTPGITNSRKGIAVYCLDNSAAANIRFAADLAKAMEEAGKQMAQNHFYNELKLTDEVAVKLENIIDIGPRLL